VDLDPNEVHRTRQADLGIVGDPRSVLLQLVEETRPLGGGARHASWLERLRRARQAFVARWDQFGHEQEPPISALRIMREIKPFLADDITFLLDGGNIGRWAHMILWDRHPTFWHTCGASGVVGWGIPGAVAAKLARPEHPVLLLSGDGSAGFTLGDIETALRFQTPYVAVVAHDSAWGIVAEGFPEDRRDGSALGEIRFDRVAAALGARGVYIEHPDQLGPAIEEGLGLDTVTFIHVPTQLGGLDYMARKWNVDRAEAAG
jgi:acetolactate synthase-1/2/3 large subunit